MFGRQSSDMGRSGLSRIMAGCLLVAGYVAPATSQPPPAPHAHTANHREADEAAGGVALEYSRAMDRMHAGMMAGMQETDPDRSFVVGMIPHHQGAIDMAQIMLRYGRDPQMKDLARRIIVEQAKEIAEMRRWLARKTPANER